MKSKIGFALIALTVILCLSSCTHRMTDFTVISTKNVPIGEGANVDFKKGTTRVKGKDTSHMVLVFPLGAPNLKEAIDRAIEKTPGAVGLVDGVVKSNWWTCFLYGQNSYMVEGTPLFPVERKTTVSNERNYIKETIAQPDIQSIPASQKSEIISSSNTMIFSHVVKEGENLIDIAKAYNVKIGDLIKWNNLSSSNLTKGQTLTILYSE